MIMYMTFGYQISILFPYNARKNSGELNHDDYVFKAR